MRQPTNPVIERNVEPARAWPGSPMGFARQVITGFVQGVYERLVETQYRWNEDQNKTKIYISASTPVDAEAFGIRPCIATSRSGMQFGSLGIGGIESERAKDGSVTRSDMVSGMWILQHISTKEAEAEELAFFTGEMIWTNPEVLLHYGFQTVQGPTVEQPGPAGSLVTGDPKGLVAVPLVIPYRVIRRSRSLRLGDPILRGVQLRMAAMLDRIASLVPVGSTPDPSQEPEALVQSTRTMGPQE